MSYSAPTMHLDPSTYSPYSLHDSSPDPDLDPPRPVHDDENASLRSQALNADGTPKRPMNAFMIFARRRRPQVSAANQTMRTGEISKILSKEWNTMPISDKQFYLDQAKKLKENFNQKYPDYVYRRRPNNSRKKRRTDAAVRGVDVYSDPRDDSLSPHDSPNYHHAGAGSALDSLLPDSLAAPSYRLAYAAHPHYHSAPPAAPVPYPYYSTSRQPHSLYASLPGSVSFPPAAAHSPSIYHSEDELLSAAAAAAYPRVEPVKLEPAWGSSALSARRGTLHPPSLRGVHGHHARHWSDSSASNPSPSAPSFPPFQTLTAPFYPSSGTVSPSTASSSSAASYFGGAGAERDFDSHPSSHHQQHPQQQQQQQQPPPPPSQQQPTQHQEQHQEQQPPAAHGHSPSFQPPLRQYAGPTLGSTLSLSPGLWSSVRSSSTSVTPKSEF